ncbi:MAG: hypothetical protein R2851_25500 [Caldilineaceae bacterium]
MSNEENAVNVRGFPEGLDVLRKTMNSVSPSGKPRRVDQAVRSFQQTAAASNVKAMTLMMPTAKATEKN